MPFVLRHSSAPVLRCRSCFQAAHACYPANVDTRITVEAGKRSGQPCIRGLRITVWDVLGWLAAGMSEPEILDDFPELEQADFPAVYAFAAIAG